MPGRIMTVGDARLKHEVIPHIEARNQIELLKYQTEPVAPQCRQAGIAEIRNGRVGEPYLAGVGPIEACDQMQERALAATGFAGQRDALACRDAQVHAAEYGDLLAGGTIGLGQIANAQHDLLAGCHAKRVTMKAPLIVAQHTRTITRDQGLKDDGDAIVIWLQLPSETASAA